MTVFNHPQSKSYGRIAGLFYIVIAVAGVFSIAYVPSVVVVPGDPAATVAAIDANAGLFGLGVVGDAVVMLSEIMLTAMLYFMFRPVSPALALAAAFARLTMVTVMAAMLFFTALALDTMGGAVYLGVFDVAQREALALLFLDAHDFGVVIWQLFFALHLVLLGYLVLRSGAFPKILGFAMTVGAFGYLLDSAVVSGIADSVALTYASYGLLGLVALGEIGFGLWLLIRGPGTFTHRDGARALEAGPVAA
ncbi:DUF4386 domain-containing protein [Pelagibacterium xiamenense]|uniref:DUF4386 domain-containing protein n=1 Tax=Pelagibacterium xiamenense TaxID=2901140 RepID=UPI001E65CF58|nr:DUF4386 domain-containing protein [Pelagibacterium xiamenense]